MAISLFFRSINVVKIGLQFLLAMPRSCIIIKQSNVSAADRVAEFDRTFLR